MGELLQQANLQEGALMVIGCSSSEMVGQRIGKGSSMEAAEALWGAVAPLLAARKIRLAVQCCEHLNRALIVERETVPVPDAGGAFATTAFRHMQDAVAVECILADAGLDIGGTLIGMHLKRVAVPVRVSLDKIGEARIVCARTRPKYIGGPRAAYQEMER